MMGSSDDEAMLVDSDAMLVDGNAGVVDHFSSFGFQHAGREFVDDPIVMVA